MTASRVRAHYEVLIQISSRLAQQAETTRQLFHVLKSKVEMLQGGQWVGQNAEMFYRQMNSEVLPALSRLAAALKEAAGRVQQINQVLQRAEAEAAGLFHFDSDSSAARVGQNQTGASAAGRAGLGTHLAAGPAKTRQRPPRRKGRVIRVERENKFKRRPPGPGAYTGAEYQKWQYRHPYAAETTEYIYPGESDKEKKFAPEEMWRKGYYYARSEIDPETGKPAEIWLTDEADQGEGEAIKIVRNTP